MLSYRHAFHAGNFADVLKHFVQVEILRYLHQKEKPFVYIDTHSGAGLYSLQSEEAEKNSEYLTGIGALQNCQWPELQPYLEVVKALSERDGQANLYPGSPAIGQAFLREDDRAQLFELHPSDFDRLNTLMKKDRRVRVYNSDGFAGLIANVPPLERRGLILMDPPYEIKTDYETVVSTIEKAYRRFATGTYALWYPVVDRNRIIKLEQALKNSGIKRIQLFELGLTADTEGRGMTSSGMIVINPPWTLKTTLDTLLPKLADQLGQGRGVWRSEELVGE